MVRKSANLARTQSFSTLHKTALARKTSQSRLQPISGRSRLSMPRLADFLVSKSQHQTPTSMHSLQSLTRGQNEGGRRTCSRRSGRSPNVIAQSHDRHLCPQKVRSTSKEMRRRIRTHHKISYRSLALGCLTNSAATKNDLLC